jgi:ribosomal protein L40E
LGEKSLPARRCRMAENKALFWTCLKCGAENPQTAETCEKCGFSFQVVTSQSGKRKPRLLPQSASAWILAILLLLMIIVILSPFNPWIEPSIGSPRAHAATDMRSLSLSIDAYMVDVLQYPACAKGDDGINAMLSKDDPSRDIFTFRVRRADRPDGQIMTLSTPTSYITSYPPVPQAYAKDRRACYGYYNDRDKGYILFCPGPDRDYDIDPLKDYDALTSNPLPRLLLKTYDPTNGEKSDGDLWRIKQ